VDYQYQGGKQSKALMTDSAEWKKAIDGLLKSGRAKISSVQPAGKKKPSAVKHKYGAKPISADDVRNPHDINFPSTVEFKMYDSLKRHGIDFEYQKGFEILPAIDVAGKHYKPLNAKIDFWLPAASILMDTKGKVTEAFRYRARLVMQHLYDVRTDLGKTEPLPPILLVKSGQVESFIQLLKLYGHHSMWPENILKRFQM
jgi:hypothetical protein